MIKTLGLERLIVLFAVGFLSISNTHASNEQTQPNRLDQIRSCIGAMHSIALFEGDSRFYQQFRFRLSTRLRYEFGSLSFFTKQPDTPAALVIIDHDRNGIYLIPEGRPPLAFAIPYVEAKSQSSFQVGKFKLRLSKPGFKNIAIVGIEVESHPTDLNQYQVPVEWYPMLEKKMEESALFTLRLLEGQNYTSNYEMSEIENEDDVEYVQLRSQSRTSSLNRLKDSCEPVFENPDAQIVLSSLLDKLAP